MVNEPNRSIETIKWLESHNGFDIECELKVAKHEGSKNNIFVTIPGVDGDIDGYEDKYLRIAEDVNNNHGFTVFQINNPYISRIHWESNVRQLLDYIYLDNDEVENIYVLAHSAGAWTLGNIAHEYPEIKRLLLINPASNIDIDEYIFNLEKSKDKQIHVLVGSEDPFFKHLHSLRNITSNIYIIEGADHNFSGDTLEDFINSPSKYLFN